MTIQLLPSREPEIIYTGKKAIEKLNELGLIFEDIEKSTSEALKEFINLPKYAYSMDRNSFFFYKLILHFREIVLKKGWSYDDSYNVNKTLNPKKEFAIVFSSGNENVCNIYETPCTKNKRGEVSLAIVEMNKYIQTNFLSALGFVQPEQKRYDIGKIPHWFFIFKRNKNKVKIELSLAKSIDRKTHKICEWSERIILPEIEYKEPPSTESDIIPVSPKPVKPNLCYDKEKELGITRK